MFGSYGRCYASHAVLFTLFYISSTKFLAEVKNTNEASYCRTLVVTVIHLKARKHLAYRSCTDTMLSLYCFCGELLRRKLQRYLTGKVFHHATADNLFFFFSPFQSPYSLLIYSRNKIECSAHSYRTSQFPYNSHFLYCKKPQIPIFAFKNGG